MLRQLVRLTRRVPAAGPRALAIAIYSDASAQPAGASGEGVACVDDAARGVELLAAVWKATGSRQAREWAAGLFDFVLWMHQGDGAWVNFIATWDGDLNGRGLTSAPGVNFWQARAISAAVSAATVLGDERAVPIVELGLAEAAAARSTPSDVRSLHLDAQLRWLAAGRGGEAEGRARVRAWAAELAATRIGQVLMNSRDERGTPHLWGHIQESVLAAAGTHLSRPDLVEVAEASSRAFVEPTIESGFALSVVQPYDVQALIQDMDALALATGKQRYTELAGLGRAWFDGRNPAGRPVYDRTLGTVADGIDHGEVSRNSGAESNIAGGLALPGAAARSASMLTGHPAG